jgi:uncharacterized protein YgfB (UPF0149 family)
MCVEPPDLPTLDAVADEIVQWRMGIDAAELHGSLCGFLSGGGKLARHGWLTALALEAEGDALRPDGALDQLYCASCAQLADADLGFVLLLPDEDRSVDERAEALLGWCRGFLGGFGLSAGAEPALSPEAAEALEDLAKIAASRLSYDDPEGDEAALTEVAEFVRVAALAAARRLRGLGPGASPPALSPARAGQACRIHASPPPADAHGRARRDPDPAGRGGAHPQQRQPLSLPTGQRLLVSHRLP